MHLALERVGEMVLEVYRNGRVVDAKGTKARYVRLWSNGNTSNDMNHYCEVEVFGTPAK